MTWTQLCAVQDICIELMDSPIAAVRHAARGALMLATAHWKATEGIGRETH
jgi:hypothetical protein